MLLTDGAKPEETFVTIVDTEGEIHDYFKNIIINMIEIKKIYYKLKNFFLIYIKKVF